MAPDLRELPERGRLEPRGTQRLGAGLGTAEEKEVRAGGKADVHRSMRANGGVQRADADRRAGTSIAAQAQAQASLRGRRLENDRQRLDRT